MLSLWCRRHPAGATRTGVLLLAAACTAVFAAILVSEVVEAVRATQVKARAVSAQPSAAAAVAPAVRPPAPEPPVSLKAKPGPPKPEPASPRPRPKAALPPEPKSEPKPKAKPTPPAPARRDDRFGLELAVSLVGGAMKRTIVLDPAAKPPKRTVVTLDFNRLSASEALKRLCHQAGVAAVERDGALLITTPARARTAYLDQDAWRRLPQPQSKRVLASLSKKVSFDCVETPLPDIVSFLSAVLGVHVMLDPQVRYADLPGLTVRANEMSVGQALRWACRLAGLIYFWHDGAIYITSSERAGKVLRQERALRPLQQPPTPELAAQVAKPISFDFVEAPLPRVLSYIASLTKAPLVLDAEAVRGKAPTVTRRVEDMPLDRALRWVCRVSGLTYVWRDGKLLVTTPARAWAAVRRGR